MRLSLPLAVSCSLFAPLAVPALVLDSLFTENMILQRDKTLPVSGKAARGEQITVRFRGQTKTAVADTAGKWLAQLDPVTAGGPFALEVQGKDTTLKFSNVAVGDIWFCSGQSNMKWDIGGIPDFPQDSVKAINLPMMRYWNVADSGKKWSPVSGTGTREMTAVGFLALRGVHLDQKIPVGIIQAAFGGAMIESFLPPGGPKANSSNYKNYIVPLLGYPIRGILWYQGESNRTSTQWPVYNSQLTYLINGLRSGWKSPDMPFYIVQLPKFQFKQTSPNEPIAYAGVREAQRLALSIKNTAMVVSIDLDSADSVDIHPMNKYALGTRFSKVILGEAYGKNIPHLGPMYNGMTVEGSRIRLKFRDVGTGLMAKGGVLKGFTIAGADSNYAFADAVLDGNDVLVSAKSVPSPTRVRYAFADNPLCTLYNKEGFPAVPFQTSGPQLTVAIAPAPAAHAAGGLKAPDPRVFTVDALGRLLDQGRNRAASAAVGSLQDSRLPNQR